MTKLVTFDAPSEAEGHPSECTEVVSGTVESDAPSSVTITTADGTTKGVATVSNASIHFDSHSHDYDGSCHNDQTHDLDPDSTEDSSSLTINGSPIYIVGDGVTTDPGSGGNVNITGPGNNNTVSESE